MIRFYSVATKKELWGQLLWFLGWLGMTAIGIWLSPSKSLHGTHTQLGLPPCGSVVLFHRPCPGCGLTTSVTATLHGQFLIAFQANIFGPIFYTIYTASAVASIVAWFKTMKMDVYSKQVNIALISMLAVYVIFGIIRFILVSDFKPY